MKVLEEITMPYNTARLFVVKKGQHLGISTYSVVCAIPINLDNTRERFDQARAKAHNAKVFLSSGDKLYSKFANPMMTIIKDTFKGKHDLQLGLCSKTTIDRYWESIKARDPLVMETLSETINSLGIKRREDFPAQGCWENL